MELTKIQGRISTSEEKITISSTAKGFTSALILPTSGDYIGIGCREAFITCEDADIRFWLSGSTPTASLGHMLKKGESLTIENYDDIANFLAIRDNAIDANIFCTYKF